MKNKLTQEHSYNQKRSSPIPVSARISSQMNIQNLVSCHQWSRYELMRNEEDQNLGHIITASMYLAATIGGIVFTILHSSMILGPGISILGLAGLVASLKAPS